MKADPLQFVYFGGEPLGVPVLEELARSGLLPALIVTSPDRPVGRKQLMTPPPVKVWAEKNKIPVLQPESAADKAELGPLLERDWELFVVVAFNRILPKRLIEHPGHGTINLHPSLLPALRGPSPIRSAILSDEPGAVGVSVILLDEKMDHGPIITQEPFSVPEGAWPIDGRALDAALAAKGGQLLGKTIPAWVGERITPTEQDHSKATYTARLARADGELLLDPYHLPEGEEARRALLTIRAMAGYPETFFIHRGKRVKIKEAELAPGGQLRLLRVVPEGKPEMDLADWLATLPSRDEA